MGKYEFGTCQHNPKDQDPAPDLSIEKSSHPGDNLTGPIATLDLLPTERWLVDAIARIEFGRIEFLQIRDGQLVVDPPPMAIRDVKFPINKYAHDKPNADFTLKKHLADLIRYVRGTKAGEIRTLFIRHRLPFEMEIQVSPEISNER